MGFSRSLGHAAIVAGGLGSLLVCPAEAKPPSNMPALPQGAAPVREAFRYKSVTAGVSTDPTTVGSCAGDQIPGSPVLPEFNPMKDVETTCSAPGDPVTAGVRVVEIYTFAKRSSGNFALSRLLIASDQENWATLLRAFSAKYGANFEASVEPWESRAGTKMDNHLATWKFSGGILTLKEYGYRITKTEADYIDDVQAPAAPPKIDF